MENRLTWKSSTKDPVALSNKKLANLSLTPAYQLVNFLPALTPAVMKINLQSPAKRLPPQPITENCQSASALGTLLTKIYPTATLKKPKTSTALKTSKSGSKAEHSKKTLPSIDQSSNLNIYVPEIGF